MAQVDRDTTRPDQGATLRPSLRFVFSAQAGTPDLVFVEVEDEHGASIDVGVWTSEGQDRRVLTIHASEGGGS